MFFKNDLDFTNISFKAGLFLFFRRQKQGFMAEK